MFRGKSDEPPLLIGVSEWENDKNRGNRYGELKKITMIL